MARTGVCPRCKINPVVKVGKYGALPCCSDCLSKSIRGRYDRRNAKQKAGLIDTHRNASGERYPDRFVPIERACYYCHQPFMAHGKSNGRHVCKECLPVQFEEKRKKQVENSKRLYRQKPEEIKSKRIRATLKRAGLPEDWYDKQKKVCGICKTIDPGADQGWCIDHDHNCCPYGIRQGCAKCIRGLLCNKCNRGLGYFKDSPAILRAAIRWLEKKPVKLF